MTQIDTPGPKVAGAPTGAAARGLRVTDLYKEYPTPGEPLVVLRGVDLALSPGEAVAVVGPSGSGKSTLLNILGTLDRPTRGDVRLDGVDPFELSVNELADFRGKRVGFIFQDHHLLPQCTALENVLVEDEPDASPKLTRRAPRSCSASSGWRAARRTSRPSCPAASGSGSRSPGH